MNVLLIGGCGYIGSYLYTKLKNYKYDVTVCDKLIRGNPLDVDVICDDYHGLNDDLINSFDAILWFAGHSSVQQSILDPEGALQNNCLNLFDFSKRIKKRTKFIYASSASLYSTTDSVPKPACENSLLHIPSTNTYDVSKFAFDYLAEHFLTNFYGLRMGTLAGYSPNLRKELVWNSMNIAAFKNNKIKLMNRDSFRTILFLDDLWNLISNILNRNIEPGFINVGSLSTTMGELACMISEVWGSDIEDCGVSPTYSFNLDLTKMKNICGDSTGNTGFDSRCFSFSESINGEIL